MSAPVSVAYNADQSRVAFTLYHPKGNIVTAEMVATLRSALESNAQNHRLKVITIEGAGGDFSFGASIPEHAPDQIAAILPEMHALIYDLLDAPAVTAAVVRGRCLGGGFELALACDFLYASEKAKLGQPEVNLGIIPGFGGTQRLARRVGVGRARELCYTGDAIGAEEALRIGLVNAVVPHAELMGKVKDVAGKIAKKGPIAIAQCKRVIFSGEDVPLDVANALETQAFAMLFGTKDRREGMSAFLEKRAAAFTKS